MENLDVRDEWQQSLGLVTLGVKAKEAFGGDGQQDVNRAGVPKWIVSVAAEDGTTFTVSVPSAVEPPLTKYAPVWFGSLMLGGSVRGLWWAAQSAQSIKRPGGGE